MTSSLQQGNLFFKEATVDSPLACGCAALFALPYLTGAAHAGGRKSWRHLDGHYQLPKRVLSVTFNNGFELIARPAGLQPITAAA
jgi:hypothetical protein